MNLSKKIIIRRLLLSIIFFIGIFLGLLSWNKIILPYQNPWGVTGPLTEIRYNPINDLVRFVIFLLFPVLMLSLVYLLNIKKLNNICFGKELTEEDRTDFNCRLPGNLPGRSRTFSAIIFVLLSILIAINIPTSRASGRFDPFHEGESLGSAVSYMKGQIPYKDFIPIHGIYQDPLRSVVAFRLFGRSIGSVRTLESINKILAFLLLSVFIIIIYRGNYIYSFATIIILAFFHAPILVSSLMLRFYIPRLILIPSRDITTFSFLITIPLLQSYVRHRKINSRKLFIITFLFSFIPLASFCYSIDRGFYLFPTYLIVSPLLYFCFFHRSIFRVQYLISSFLGLLSAILMGFLLRGNFLEFFRFTFLIMPRYKELTDGHVYPIYKIPFLIVCIFIAANTYWVIFKFIQEFHLNNKKVAISIKTFVERYLIEFCLLLLSVFFFRNALGRSDIPHVAYSFPVAAILSIYIFIKYYLDSVFYKNNFFRKIFAYSVTFIIILIYSASAYTLHHKNLILRNFPIRVKDSVFVPDNHKETISFLRHNLDDNEGFFTMTSEGSWYYFIDKPCPVRFPVVWLAMPYFYQTEMVEDLRNSNVKFILYKNNCWTNAMDGFRNEIKLPLVVNYIVEDYVFFRKIDDNEIWIKKAE